MFVVDTNVLVYAIVEACPEHSACFESLERWRASPLPWFTTWPILYETMRVVTHRRAVRSPWKLERAAEFVSALLASPSLKLLTPTSAHSAVLARTIEEVPGLAGSILHDLHTAVLMREHGIRRIVTRDGDFHRFPFLDVIDPLKPDGTGVVRERAPKRSRQTSRSTTRA